MSRVVAYTSANLGYLDRASLLRESVRRHHPEIEIVLVLVDALPKDQSLLDEISRFDQVLLPDDLVSCNARQWLFGYDVVEACTAMKGPALVTLLEQGADRVLYLDPDIALFDRLDATLATLGPHSVALTPHQLMPATTRTAVQDNEITSLLTGVYNLGFLGVNNDEQGRTFARWWADRLMDFCYDDSSRGLFTDQRWMDLVPVFFERTTVLRDPGLNVASWNIAERNISLDAHGSYLANDAPLRFYHFTKALGVGPTMTFRYAGSNTHVAELWRWYLQQLEAVRKELPSPPLWAFGYYDDGTEVPVPHRRIYRARLDLHAAFPDPFASAMRSWMLGTLGL
jgi:hypothetical protein